MRAAAFWKTVTLDHSNFLQSLVVLLEEHGMRYCVIGGQGVNAYVEPLVSLDLDLVIAVDQLPQAEELLRSHFGERSATAGARSGRHSGTLRLSYAAWPSPHPQYPIPFEPGELSLRHLMLLLRPPKQPRKLRPLPNRLQPRIAQHGGITKEP